MTDTLDDYTLEDAEDEVGILRRVADVVGSSARVTIQELTTGK
jgi:hypothetical protein